MSSTEWITRCVLPGSGTLRHMPKYVVDPFRSVTSVGVTLALKNEQRQMQKARFDGRQARLTLRQCLYFPHLHVQVKQNLGKNKERLCIFALWFEIRQMLSDVRSSQSKPPTAPSLPGKSHHRPMATQRFAVLFRSVVVEANAPPALFVDGMVFVTTAERILLTRKYSSF